MIDGPLPGSGSGLADALHGWHLLLTAAAGAWTTLVDAPAVPIRLIGHGLRSFLDHLSLRRVVTWLGPVFPMIIERLEHDDLRQGASAVQRSIAALTHRGESFDTLKHDAEGLPDAPLLFSFDGALAPSDHPHLGHSTVNLRDSCRVGVGCE